MAGLLLLFALPTVLLIQPGNAAVTTNCTTVGGIPTSNCSNAGGNAATAIGNARKVFYYNGYWWIFWAQGSAIDYQWCQGSTVTSCSVSSAWSTAATFTASGAADSANGQGFTAWLDGADLVYAAAPASASGTQVFWGIVQLGAGSFTWLVQNQAMNLGVSGWTGVANPRISVAVDGNNYLWIAVAALDGGVYYQNVYECTDNILTNPTGCQTATWDTTNTIAISTNNAAYVSNPTLLPLTSSTSVYYMSLTYIDAAASGIGGPLYTFVSQSGSVSGTSISWVSSCGGSSTTAAPTEANACESNYAYSSGGADGIYYSAASSGATLYVVSSVSGVATASLSYTLGAAAFSGFDAWLTASVIPTLSISGTVAVMTYPTGSSVQFYYCPLASITSGADGWVGPTNLALNSEISPNWADSSVTSYTVGGYNLIGVIWENSVGAPYQATQRVRFAVISMSNAGVVPFPVSLVLSLDEYNEPTSPNYAASATNYFTVAYTVCNEVGCSGNGTYQYRSSSGAPLTINNVQSYTSFTITDQSSASTSAEKWCLLGGGSCAVGSLSTYGSSDTLDEAFYYYDQLAEPNLYAIATPSIFSEWGTTAPAAYGTVNYDTVTTETAGAYYPNPTTSQPYIVPRAAIYASASTEETAYWVRARDILTGCTSQSIYPADSGSTCAPSVSFGTLSAGGFTVGYPTVTVPTTGAPVLEFVPIAITNSQASATPNGLQVMVTIDSATFAQYEATNLQNIEFFTASGAVLPSWLESGNVVTSTSSVYWVNLGTNTIPAGSTLTIYMGFAATFNSFFTSQTGLTGEAPQLSPAYAEFDNGAVVFPAGYWDFSGSSLPAGWTNTLISGTTTAGTTNGVLKDASANWVASSLVNFYLTYTSGPAAGQTLIITANTANTITTASFTHAPDASGDTFTVTSGGFTVNNGISFSGALTSVIETTSASYPDTGITEANFQVSDQTNYGGVMLVSSSGGGQYTIDNWETVGNAVGDAQNGFDIDVYAAGNNFRSFAGGAGASIPSSVSPGSSSFIEGGTVNSAAGCATTCTIEYVNELSSKTTAYISSDVPVSGNYYVASGDLVGQIFSYNWLRIRTYPNGGVMPTVAVGPVTPASGSSNIVKEYAPITLTNSYTTATPPYFQVDVNVTSNSPAFFSGTSSGATTGSSFTGVSTSYSSATNTMTDAGAAWSASEWVGDYLQFTSGPAAGQFEKITGSTTNTVTVGTAFSPAPDSSGGDSFTILGVTVLQDASANWSANQWVGDYLSITSGPASGQSLQIMSNTANSVTTLSFNPAPTAGGGDKFNINNGFSKYEGSQLQNVEFFTCSGSCSATATLLPSWLESGGSDTASNSIYWVRIPSSIASTGTLTIYIGFASVAANLMSSTGYVGEAPNLSTTYGSADNGVQVFNFYTDFVGTSTGSQWAPTSTINSGNSGLNYAIGQLALNTNYQNEHITTVTPAELNDPDYAVMYGGNLWVVDSGNNRILEFAPPFTNGEAPSLVIGQAGFGSGGAATTASGLNDPRYIAFDSSGDLWVADTGNNRILEFSAPLSTGEAATLVLGQTGFATSSSATTQTGLYSPRAIAFDSSGNLWVADAGNNRVLEYTPAFTTGEAASLVLGQSLYTSSGSAASAAGENLPSGLAFDSSGNLWVADSNNNRVLEYLKGAAFTTDEAATLVLGQPLLTTNAGNLGNAFPTAYSLLNPIGLAFDSSGNLWVADTGNNRVLEYLKGTGFTTEMSASIVIGQTTFTGNSPGSSAGSVDVPRGVTFDSSGNLWVADTNNNRVTEFAKGTGFTSGEAASTVIGQPSFSIAADPLNLYDPTSAAFDSSGDLWVVDSGNNRILEFKENNYQFYTGESASIVIGQSSFTTSASGTTSSSLNDPTYIAFDSSGNLWVADTGNNRILEFLAPLSTGESASLVIGQSSMTAGGAATTQSGLKTPHEIAFDSSGNLWVADTGNNRVLEYLKGGGFTNGEAASTVIGQSLYTSGTPVTSVLFSGTTSAGTTATVLQDSVATWAVNALAGDYLEYTSGTASGQTIRILSNTLNTITTVAAFSPAPDATGDTFSVVGSTASTLNSPWGVAFDPSGNLWVSDSGDNRVLEYMPGFTTDEAAVTVIGQPFLSSATTGASSATIDTAANLRDPTGITFDYWGDLWVADTGNNRILEFEPTYNSLFTGIGAVTVMGANNYADDDAGYGGSYGGNWNGPVSSTSENAPMGVAFDELGNIWLADTGDNRIVSQATGSLVVNNGVTVRQTTAWMGVISKVTINPQTNILEFDGFFSSPSATTNNFFGLNTPAAATPTPTPNSLNVFETNSGNFALHTTSGTANIVPFTLPATAPTVTYVEAESACTGGPIYYPATTTTCSASPSMTTSTAVYWALRNWTLSEITTIPSLTSPYERWATPSNSNQGESSWTVTSVFQVNPAVNYYHQYENTYTFLSGGLITSFSPNVSFTLYGTVYGVQNSPVATFGLSDPTQPLYFDVGSVVLFPSSGTITGGPGGVQWENSNNQSQTVVVNTPGTCTTLCTATYYEQYEQFLYYKTSDLSSLPTGSIPLLTYTSLGKTYTIAIPTKSSIIWVDALTTATSTSTIQSPSALFTGTTSAGTTANKLVDTSASWSVNQFVGDYLTYTSGNAAGQSLLITANTAEAITTASSFSPAPSGSGGDSFVIVTMSQRWITTTDQWTVTCSNTQLSCLSFTGTSSSASQTEMTDNSGGWATNEWTGYYLTYLTGPAAGLSEPITSNTGTQLFTSQFSISPTVTGGDSFEITGGIPNPITFYHQYEQIVEPYKTSDYNPITSATTPYVSIVGESVKTNYQLQSSESSPVLVWADANSMANVTTPLPGGMGERWLPPTSSWTITGSNLNGGVNGIIGPFGNATVLYDHQFQITYVTTPTDPGFTVTTCSYPIPSCSSVSYTTVSTPPLGTAVWQTTPFTVTISSSDPTYITSGLAGTSGICLKTSPFTGPCSSLVSSSQAEAFLTSEGTITALFTLKEGVTFIQTGIFESPTNPTDWYVTVTNSTCPAQAVGGMCSWGGESTSSALSITLVCQTLPSCSYTYTVESPVYNDAGNTRYFVTQATGVFMLSPSESSTEITLTYTAQYKLTIESDPADAGALTGSYTNATVGSGSIPSASCGSPCTSFSHWFNPGSTANFGVTVANPQLFSVQPIWLGWTGTGCPPSGGVSTCDNEGSVSVAAMTGPVTLTANFQTALSMQITPPDENAYIGETVTTDVEVFGGIGNVTISAAIPPGLQGLISIEFYTVQNPGGAANPLTFGSSVDWTTAESTLIPTGQIIIMSLTVSQHATLYGALNFTVIAQSSGYEAIGGVGAIATCTLTGQLFCIDTLNILAPTPTVVGNAETPFAITTAGQSSLFFLDGHWIVFYYNGSASSGELVYSSSKDANGSLWNTPQIVPTKAGIQGYDYAVMVSGNYIYYVLTSSNNNTAGLHWTYFYSNYGTIAPSTGMISWALPSPQPTAASAGPTPVYIAGQPSIVAGPFSGDVYVAVPALFCTVASATCSGGSWQWKVDVWVAGVPAFAGELMSWSLDYQTALKSVSAVNVKLYALSDSTMGVYGVALVDWSGNGQSLPYVTVLSDPPGTTEVDECNVGPSTPTLISSIDLPGWQSYIIYGSQSDIMANLNVIYFAGVNATNSVVNFYTYTYTGPSGGARGSCGSGENGGWSSVQQIPVGSPTNKASDWHVSLSWSAGSIIIGYGVDSQLGFVIGTENGQSWSWYVLPSVEGVTGIQGGLTAAFAQAGGGSGTVGMVWVQKITSGEYAIEFALA